MVAAIPSLALGEASETRTNPVTSRSLYAAGPVGYTPPRELPRDGYLLETDSERNRQRLLRLKEVAAAHQPFLKLIVAYENGDTQIIQDVELRSLMGLGEGFQIALFSPTTDEVLPLTLCWPDRRMEGVPVLQAMALRFRIWPQPGWHQPR